jgi:outer membrane immunogenic protein
MHKAIAAGLAAVFGLSLPAQAADLNGGSLKDAPVSYGPGHSWAGLYVGGSVGFGRGDITHIHTALEEEYETGETYSESRASDDRLKGAIYGAHLGYNWQFGHVVAGLEAGINGTNIEGSEPIGEGQTVKTELDWYATTVARLGYAEGSWLLYGFGGLAWARLDTSTGPHDEGYGSGTTNHLGWTAGVGVEYAFGDRLSVRVEYSHVDLGEETVSSRFVDHDDHSHTYSTKADLDFDAVKVGASYRLFGPERSIDPLK